MEMNKPKVDVIIPTYKPTQRLIDLILLLENQTVPVNKIILMNTEEKYFNNLFYGKTFVKERTHLKVCHLSRMEFNHGKTRAEGVKISDAPYFILMTDDALPKDETLVEKMLEPILNGEAQFSYARQLANADCGLIERFTRVFNYKKESCVKSIQDLDELGIKTYFFSNVCAAYTRECYDEAGGFEPMAIFNEDMVFAANALKKGYKIAYAASAKVYHSHNYTAMQQLHRNFDLGVSQADHPEIFGQISSTGEGKKLVRMTCAYLRQKKKMHLIPKLFLHSGCKYIGYTLGKNYQKLPESLILKLTMNKPYWTQRNMKNAIKGIDPYSGYGISEDERK